MTSRIYVHTNADTTPDEAESRALLEEAMAMASGEDVPIRIPSRPVSFLNRGVALSFLGGLHLMLSWVVARACPSASPHAR